MDVPYLFFRYALCALRYAFILDESLPQWHHRFINISYEYSVHLPGLISTSKTK
jgi:hypothetical protein